MNYTNRIWSNPPRRPHNFFNNKNTHENSPSDLHNPSDGLLMNFLKLHYITSLSMNFSLSAMDLFLSCKSPPSDYIYVNS